MARTLKSKALAPAQPIISEPAPDAPPAGAPKRIRRRATVDLRRKVLVQPSLQFTDAELAIQALMREAEEARGDLTKFYRLVMRHETTKLPLEPAPHQEVMFSFLQHHDRCVFRQPINTAKTFGMAAATLWFMGNDVTQRGVMLSKTQAQAAKPLKMVADYITEPALNKALHLVFPHLVRSPKANDAWTSTALTIKRPAGIRDASLLAVGLDGSIQGSRISWLMADDTLDQQNTRTQEARVRSQDDLEGHILSRLDTDTPSRAVFTNTPWDREDLTYYLEKTSGWPTLTMDIYGNLTITNADAAWLFQAEQTLIRPSAYRKGCYRLLAHDPDPNERIPLWPDRMPLFKIEARRKNMPPHQFARQYLCEPFDGESQRCQKDWIEKCKKRGIGTSLVPFYRGNNQVVCGIDVAIGTSGRSDLTVLFVIEVEPDGSRRILHIESGRMSGPDIVDRIIHVFEAYKASMVVESNTAQDFIRQFAVDKRKDLMVHAHTTSGFNKHSEDFGVESIFTELQQGAWIIPCDYNGDVDPEVQKWIDDCLFYQPSKHTGDHLMACWIARERIRRGNYADPSFQSTSTSEWLQAQGAAGF